MGSFFYGNNFGSNYQMFPFIAAKCSKNILFDKSRFSNDTKAKASTARVVLGNMIRDTGNVYTYEVSFFGNYKEVLFILSRMVLALSHSLRNTIGKWQKP
jgi:hypothetical protein